MLFKLDGDMWRQMETLRDKWRYVEIDRNILKQPVLTKEQSQLPIDEKSLRLSVSAVCNESC
ncbi:hypothetical protein DMA11_18490 [Marinilabiliaceae bacterium JC017]|nr:hypothetical protein DMA11_18490 [Marinilabiliaceae bacterium JC017]